MSFKDSLDGAFDLSDWVIDAHGFVPVPIPITEPAIGYGAALMPVFISPRKPTAANAAHKNMAPPMPNMTGVMGMYTANGSWAVGAARSANFDRWNLRYTVLLGYTNINISYYRTVLEKEREIEVNLKMIPVFLRGTKRIGYSNWHLGGQYFFSKTKAKLRNDTKLDSLFSPKEFDNLSSIIGAVIQYDSRDNIFTPNKGTKFHFLANWSTQYLGSDFNYVHLNPFAYQYIPFSKKWVCGFRADMQQVIGDAPFYLLPSIDLRGVPKGRYQGKTNLLVETEQRWNAWRRWSLIFFGGTAKAFNEYSDFGEAEWVYNYGTGIRYLLARKLGLYTGVDVARGPEQFAFYVQFGNGWSK
ncbi:surface antigen-like protein [Chitinophaga skermanii]|uniref:Surface antigen-like protein n=1 Tax=Chitinophaga skermanii TaxID=331697 RepID=A0A327QRR6_9BACT|nr:BamA/TamA family outer membrane protein [Chitinophaga skermanii]RAJ06595.1 surface antigen-like protein [Chitinophaga skermanii]